jgi:archaellum component FlaG (FlaF/FlaG flagellin family)
VQVTISTAILMITTIIAASIFSAAALSQLYEFQNAIKDVGSRNEEVFSSSITIIGEANSSSPSTHIVIWVKNTGRTSFQIEGAAPGTNSWDLFVIFPNGTYKRYSYASACSNDCWGAQILNDQGVIGVWEQSETLEISVYTATIPEGSYEVRLALPNGVTCEDRFSLG